MIQAKIVNRINFPEIILQKDLEHIAKNIIIPDMIAGIDSSAAINGGKLPANEPATVKRKMSNKPLIETGELRSSFFYRLSGKSKVLISIKGGRKEIGGYLQNDGIKTKSGKKHYRFFGISRDAHDGAMDYMRDRIRELTRGGKGK